MVRMHNRVDSDGMEETYRSNSDWKSIQSNPFVQYLLDVCVVGAEGSAL